MHKGYARLLCFREVSLFFTASFPPGFLLSNVKLTCSSGTRILMLFSRHTKNDSPNSVVNIAGIFASSVEHRG